MMISAIKIEPHLVVCKTNILWKKLNDYLDIGQECRSTLNCVTVKVYFRENFRPTQCPSF